ncbi:MAG: hypothetical protein FWC42_00460 [Proteobacteria bacterium]|nr:hypothetical protein [Pseudomonadota bacterium]
MTLDALFLLQVLGAILVVIAMLAALFRVLPPGRRNRIFLANALEMGAAEQAKGA